jgi:hypothetical protein
LRLTCFRHIASAQPGNSQRYRPGIEHLKQTAGRGFVKRRGLVSLRLKMAPPWFIGQVTR